MKRRLLILALLVVPVLAVGSVKLLAQEANPYQTSPDENEMLAAREQYHRDMNTLFNDSVRLMIAGKGEKVPPENPNECQNDIDDETHFNVSTYCTAMRASQQFFWYKEALLQERSRVALHASGSQQTDVILEQSIKLRAIDEELDNAKRAMDLTLQAYDELRLAYPLHRAFQKTAADLRTYRDALKVLKQKTDEFPMRFLDATSSLCL